MTKEFSMSAEALLEFMFRILCDVNACHEISFPKKISCIAIDGSDKSGVRQGFMEYGSAITFTVNGKIWALSLGNAWGYSSIKPFIRDMIAVQVFAPEAKSDQKILEEILENIRTGQYFQHSLVIVKNNGDIVASENPKNRFREKMSDLLLLIAGSYISRPDHAAEDFIHSTIPKELTNGPVRYKTTFPDVLATLIMKVLSEE